jgi:hypothetical protein
VKIWLSLRVTANLSGPWRSRLMASESSLDQTTARFASGTRRLAQSFACFKVTKDGYALSHSRLMASGLSLAPATGLFASGTRTPVPSFMYTTARAQRADGRQSGSVLRHLFFDVLRSSQIHHQGAHGSRDPRVDDRLRHPPGCPPTCARGCLVPYVRLRYDQCTWDTIIHISNHVLCDQKNVWYISYLVHGSRKGRCRAAHRRRWAHSRPRPMRAPPASPTPTDRAARDRLRSTRRARAALAPGRRAAAAAYVLRRVDRVGYRAAVAVARVRAVSPARARELARERRSQSRKPRGVWVLLGRTPADGGARGPIRTHGRPELLKGWTRYGSALSAQD